MKRKRSRLFAIFLSFAFALSAPYGFAAEPPEENGIIVKAADALVTGVGSDGTQNVPTAYNSTFNGIEFVGNDSKLVYAVQSGGTYDVYVNLADGLKAFIQYSNEPYTYNIGGTDYKPTTLIGDTGMNFDPAAFHNYKLYLVAKNVAVKAGDSITITPNGPAPNIGDILLVAPGTEVDVASTEDQSGGDDDFFAMLMKSMKPVKDVVSEEHVKEKEANETELQRLFDNRIGPSVQGDPAIDYHVYSPADEEDTTKYPVVIWLHGMGQGYCFREPVRGTAISNYASPEYQAKFGDGAYIMVPRANEDLGMVDTIAGFMYSNTWLADDDRDGVSDHLPGLLAAIRQFLSEEKDNIDFTRIYLAGFSAGGYMTWQTLLAMPDTFAAVIPICQANFVPTTAQLNTIANVPLWVIVGEKDDLYASSVAPTIASLQKTHKAELRTTVFETVYNPDLSDVESQHFSWVPVTYDFFYNDGKPYDPNYPMGIIDWLSKQILDDRAGFGATHGYAMGQNIIDAGLIDSYAFDTGDPSIGRMDYYLYDPIKHGADPNRDYPLLVVFHGMGNGGMNDIMAGALADGMVFASQKYQKMLGGAYILFPKANEYDQPRVFEDGSVSQPTGTWMTFDDYGPTNESPYSDVLHELISGIADKNNVSDTVIAGTSMGGAMAWRYIIDHTESVSAAILVAPAMNPTSEDLGKLENAGLPIWLIHGIQDEVCDIQQITGPNADQLYSMSNVRLSLLPWVRYGDGSVVRGAYPIEMGQHLSLFCFGANMIYDNDLPYDALYQDGVTAWINTSLNGYSFSDVKKGTEIGDAVTVLFQKGIVSGQTRYDFTPNATITRAEMITILGRISGSGNIVTKPSPFIDLQDWFAGHVEWAVDNGIVQTGSGSRFNPTHLLTQADVNAYIKLVNAKFGTSIKEITNPSGNATRGQVAIIMAEFMKTK